jgi:cytidylate kinase
MPEDRRSLIDDIMEELLGLHPASWTLVHQTTETILRLAELGSVIIVGRGANVITSKLDHVFHVRLIGSPDKRVARLQQNLVIDEEAAREFLDNEDRGRKRYLETYFHADIEDPLLYDLVINTDRHPTEFVARLIAQAVLALA